MARIFIYIVHKAGVVDDSAFELAAAARKIDPTASPTAIVTGWGADLDAVCNALETSYAEIWKIADESLVYPNAELVRKALVKVLPSDSIVLLAHDHFGIDLAPGLSIRMNAAYRPRCGGDRRSRRRQPASRAPGIRRPGEHSRSV